MNMYALYDKATELFSYPFCAPTDAMALRQLGFLLQDPRSTAGKFPREISLWIVGSYDEKTGHIETDKTYPKHLAEAAVVLQEMKRDEAANNPSLPLGVN